MGIMTWMEATAGYRMPLSSIQVMISTLAIGILPRAGGRGRAGVCIISMVVVQRSVLYTMIGQVLSVLTRLFVKSLSSLVRERCRLV